MKLLLDTHVWLWMQASSGRLSAPVLQLIRDPDNVLMLSAASSWEIAIKYTLGRLPLPEPPASYVPRRIQTSAVTAVEVGHAHALHVATLPLHHRDPFDRLLIAQAQIDAMTILTADRQFEPYDVDKIWAA